MFSFQKAVYITRHEILGTNRSIFMFDTFRVQEGDFEMKHVDRVRAPTFNVSIAPFSLSTLGDDSDAL